MKSRIILYSMIAVCAAVFALSPNRATAQAAIDTPAGAELLQDLQTQQATLAENQKQIDDKLAAVAETLRQARIFVSRGGK